MRLLLERRDDLAFEVEAELLGDADRPRVAMLDDRDQPLGNGVETDRTRSGKAPQQKPIDLVGKRPHQLMNENAGAETEKVAEVAQGEGEAGAPGTGTPKNDKADDRGRVWTIQYLQYPNPAGLRRVAVDRWSR